MARDFGRSLALADVACVLDVYPARERPEDYPGVSGWLVAAATADAPSYAAIRAGSELRTWRSRSGDRCTTASGYGQISQPPATQTACRSCSDGRRERGSR